MMGPMTETQTQRDRQRQTDQWTERLTPMMGPMPCADSGPTCVASSAGSCEYGGHNVALKHKQHSCQHAVITVSHCHSKHCTETPATFMSTRCNHVNITAL